MRVPDEIAALLAGEPVVGTREQAFPFVTVDADGYPRPALLSRAEMEVGPDGADLHAAVRSRGTRTNLERSGHASLIAVEGTTAHYLTLRVARSMAVHDLLACVFEVVAHKPDSLGVALSPVLYDVTADIVRSERWDTTFDALARLRS